MTPSPLLNVPRKALDGSPIRTVSELTFEIRETLERHVGAVWVAGEVSNLRIPSSGHCYFTLKDAASQIAAVMWRTKLSVAPFKLQEGAAVLAQGEVTVYEPRGQYQIVVNYVEPLGVGALQVAFQQLKEKLEREGLFSAERKRPLPFLPRVIGIVTSPTGAAIHDMLKVILRRAPPVRVVICPVRVQGAEAAPEIAEGIRRLNRLGGVDVMIVGRGGGSLEDLWPFNEEVVARAIAGSKIPVISAVGHETDFTIADFVADVRALTPTDAANIVTPDERQLLLDLQGYRARLAQALQAQLKSLRNRLDGLARNYDPRRPLEQLRQREQRLDDLWQRLQGRAERAAQDCRHRAVAAAGRLESLSPLAVLARGYSMTFRAGGAAVREAATLKPGDEVRTRLHRGEFTANVAFVAP